MPTLLIANRGEIALRVMRTAGRTGWRTVALFTDLDADAPHTRAADEAVRVPSYLDIDAVIAAAEQSGATHIHPGYGFLSERAEFARAVEAAGLKLVGPSAAVMDLMGRKDAAREVAVRAGVPVVPLVSRLAGAGASTNDIAFPVLVKAASGGGGKGMRIVRDPADLDEAMAAAAREAMSAFGDDTLLIEKYVEHGRHIEVQVMADSHGNVVHLFERDCSTQRRHQKVLEEAPAPTITAAIRDTITTAAVNLATEVGYENAGTVEFLLDTDTGEVYFLEMNTRLQVEHPVTELVTGVDLVAVQLEVALGEPLPFAQDDLSLDGHAIEARVYAEDAFGGFLPQAGRATLVHWPAISAASTGQKRPFDGPHGPVQRTTVRVDAALESGQVVSTAYDPMLGKVIVHGPDREAARAALVEALDQTAILGFTTNVGFLRTLAAADEFRDATIDTGWLDQQALVAPSADQARAHAAHAQAMHVAAGSDDGPFRSDGFRLGGEPVPMRIELDRPVAVDLRNGLVDGEPFVDDAAWVDVGPHQVEVVHEGQRFVFRRPDPFADSGAVAGDGVLLAQMPGTVLAVHVAEGDRVSDGQALGVLEAMKMELALRAPYAGTVTKVGAATGDQVPLGALLFEVAPEEEA